ncbi:uncharacterized protein LOC131170229 [Hevea brasiliensis]|uniref:uncharacterized protein LOC131170229 n=1 Tax=Hevea brasiliensis TaxID=3981 RepID=UPI0025DC0FBC|nr:uncharacterized protein LOC131170229 [Hevea brasiliensis]
MNIDKALCDLGASVSLMSLSICQMLNVGELKPTTISLQLADWFVKYPIGVLENISIKLTLKVGEEKVEFNLFRAMKHKLDPDECLRVDIIDKLIEEQFHKKYPEDPFEACIVHSNIVDDDNKEITAYAQSIEASPPLPLAQVL